MNLAWYPPLLVVLLLAPFLSQATGTWHELQQRVDSLVAAGKLAEARPLAEESVRVAEAEFGLEHNHVATALAALGETLRQAGPADRGVSVWRRAFEIREKTLGPDHALTIRSMTRLGASLSRAGRHDESRDWLMRALERSERVLGSTHEETIRVVNNLGYTRRQAGDFPEARRYMIRDAELTEQALGAEHVDTIGTLNFAAFNLIGMRMPAEALPLAKRARDAALRVEVPLTLRGSCIHQYAHALRLNGKVQESLGEYEKGLEVLAAATGSAEKTLYSNLLSGRGYALGALGRLSEGLADHERALVVQREVSPAGTLPLLLKQNQAAVARRELGDTAMAVEAHRAIVAASRASSNVPESPALIFEEELARSLRLDGRLDEAIAQAQESLAKALASSGEARTRAHFHHRSLGRLLSERGRHAEAIAHIEAALRLQREARAPASTLATTLSEASQVYGAVGRQARALELARESLDLTRRTASPDSPNVAVGLSILGAASIAAGDSEAAVRAYGESLSIREKAYGPGHRYTVANLANLGWAHREAGRVDEALRLHEEALRRIRGGPLSRAAVGAHVLQSLGEAQLSAGRVEEGAANLRGALVIWQALEHPEALQALHHLSRGERLRGAHDAAVMFGKLAVNGIQGLRSMNSDLDPELQRALAAKHSAIYDHLAEVLVGQGRLAEAQQVLAMLKEDELHAILRREAGPAAGGTRAAFSGLEQAWARRFEVVSTKVASLGREAAALRRGGNPADRPRLVQIETDLESASRAFDAHLGEMLAAFASDAARQQTTAKLDQVEGLRETMSELGEGVVLLHYVPGPERTHIIVTTPEVRVARTAPIGVEAINRRIAAYRRQLQDPGSDPVPAARELHDLLLGPVAEDLRQAKAITVMLSLAGALRYLPFAALHDAEGWLVHKYQFVLFTDAAASNLQKRASGGWKVWGLGLTQPTPGFTDLPHVKEEIAGILRKVPGEGWFDADFTEDRFREGIAKRYPVLHVASHFRFSPGEEMNSYLVMGGGEPLTLDRIRHGPRLEGVDLLALSACETGFGGGKDQYGREVEGLGALAQTKGARGVLATLWPVADLSTSRFMQLFYEAKGSAAGTTKAGALQQAQRAFAREAGHARHAHPFFWAPFILMGNWL